MAQYIVKAKKTYLKSPLTAGASSVVLRELVDSKDNALAMADFGGWGVVVVKQGEQIEMIKFSGLAVAADGTVTLTVAANGRHIDPTTPYAGYSTGLPFQSGAEVIVTNDPLTVSQFPNKNNDETITGQWAFPTPVDDEDVATKSYVDALALGGSANINRIVSAGNAGETVADGNLLYFKVSDGEWYKADADVIATIQGVQLGIAQGAGTDGNPISGGILRYGLDDAQSGGGAGSLGYASNTAGSIGTSAGTTERVVGQFKSATDFFFDPFFYYTLTAAQKTAIPSADEKAALAGSDGTPSSTNKYLTEMGKSDAGTDQSQTTRNAGSEVGEADSTLKKNKLAQSFTAGATKIRGVKLYKDADTGTFIGTVTVALQADSSGSPSGSNLASKSFTNAQWAALPASFEFEAIFSSEYGSLTPGTLYWIVITTSTADNSNHPNFGHNSAGGYASGSTKFFNTTDGWTAIATIDLYFKTLKGRVSQVPEADASGDIAPEFLDQARGDLKLGVGPQSNTRYLNIYVPFIDPADVGTTSPFWAENGAPSLVNGYYFADFGSNPSGQIYLAEVFKFYNIGMNTTRKIFFETEVTFQGSGDLSKAGGFGFCTGDAAYIVEEDGQASQSIAGFMLKDAVLYAHTSNGTSVTRTALTGLTLSNPNTFRMEIDLGHATPQVRFYVNGVLRATHTTNVPTNSGLPMCAFGGGEAAGGELTLDKFTAPRIAIEK